MAHPVSIVGAIVAVVGCRTPVIFCCGEIVAVMAVAERVRRCTESVHYGAVLLGADDTD